MLPFPNGFDQCLPPLAQGSIPGPQGEQGTPGTPGTNGANAFTTTTLAFTVPAISANVTVPVGATDWMAVGQIVFIASAGYYAVAAIQDALDVVLTNLGYTGNAVPTTVIGSGTAIVPSGIAGAAGEAGTGVNSVALSAPVEFTVSGSPVLTTGTLAFTSAAGQIANRVYATPNGAPGPASMRALVAADIPALPFSDVTGVVSIAQGGTGAASAPGGFAALSPLTTKGDLLAQTTSNGVRVPVGTDGQVLTASSAAMPGIAWAAPAQVLTSAHRIAVSNPDVMQATDSIIGVNVAAPVSETLVSAPADGRTITIKDESGSAASSKNITISAGAGDTLQGGSTLVISNNFGYYRLYYNATSKVWFIIGNA